MVLQKKILAAIMAIVCLFILGVSFSWAEDGVSNTEVKIGATVDLSGPIAFMGKGVTDGAKLYFQYINDQGGVYGRKINFLVEDDGYQSPRAVQGAKKLITRDKVFCMFMILGSAQVNAMYPLMEADGIPIVAPATQNQDMGVPPRKFLFLADTHYTAQGKLAIEYIVEKMGEKKPKIASIFQDDTPGHDWRNGVRHGAKYYGLDVLELTYKRGAVDFSSQMAKCKEAGITHILVWSLVREPAILMKEAQRLQYKPTYFYANPSINKKVLELAGDALTYNNKIYATNIIIDPYRDKTPAVKLFEINAAKYKTATLENSYNVYGYQAAITMVEGLKRAGKDLTRQGLINALETFNKYDNGIMAPITWGPNLRAGGHSIKVFKANMEVEGGWQAITQDWVFSKIPD
ncbi:MAG: ABC transporter substrate-binding protein [Proteobacteria bacterium]|nr:ABC transporter substrate-binding protein [Pseudomonadota bacterium]